MPQTKMPEKVVGYCETEVRAITPEGSPVRILAKPGEIATTAAGLRQAGCAEVQVWQCQRMS